VTAGAGSLIVETSPCLQISLVGRGSRNEKLSGTDITSAQLSLEKFRGDWCRIVVIDHAGKIAWSNPIYP
jgi:hypothetical protein